MSYIRQPSYNYYCQELSPEVRQVVSRLLPSYELDFREYAQFPKNPVPLLSLPVIKPRLISPRGSSFPRFPGPEFPPPYYGSFRSRMQNYPPQPPPHRNVAPHRTWQESYHRTLPRRRNHLDDIYYANHDDEDYGSRSEDKSSRYTRTPVRIDVKRQNTIYKSDDTSKEKCASGSKCDDKLSHKYEVKTVAKNNATNKDISDKSTFEESPPIGNTVKRRSSCQDEPKTKHRKLSSKEETSKVVDAKSVKQDKRLNDSDKKSSSVPNVPAPSEQKFDAATSSGSPKNSPDKKDSQEVKGYDIIEELERTIISLSNTDSPKHQDLVLEENVNPGNSGQEVKKDIKMKLINSPSNNDFGTPKNATNELKLKKRSTSNGDSTPKRSNSNGKNKFPLYATDEQKNKDTKEPILEEIFVLEDALKDIDGLSAKKAKLTIESSDRADKSDSESPKKDFDNIDTQMTYLFSFKKLFDDNRTIDMDISSPSMSNLSGEPLEIDNINAEVDDGSRSRALEDVEKCINPIVEDIGEKSGSVKDSANINTELLKMFGEDCTSGGKCNEIPQKAKSGGRYRSRSVCRLIPDETRSVTLLRKTRSFNDISKVEINTRSIELGLRLPSSVPHHGKDELISLLSSDCNGEQKVSNVVQKSAIAKVKEKRTRSLDNYENPSGHKSKKKLMAASGSSQSSKSHHNMKQTTTSATKDSPKNTVKPTITPKVKYVTKAQYVKTFGRIKSPVDVALSIEIAPASSIKKGRATFTCEADNETILKKVDKQQTRQTFLELFGPSSSDDEEEVLLEEVNKEHKKSKAEVSRKISHKKKTEERRNSRSSSSDSKPKEKNNKEQRHRRSRSKSKEEHVDKRRSSSSKAKTATESRRQSTSSNDSFKKTSESADKKDNIKAAKCKTAESDKNIVDTVVKQSKRNMENDLKICAETNKKTSGSNKESKKNVNHRNNGCTEANKRTSGSEATLTANNVKCKATSAHKELEKNAFEIKDRMIPKQKEKVELALPHCDLPKRTMENSLSAPNNGCGEANKRKMSGSEATLTAVNVKCKAASADKELRKNAVETEDKTTPKQKAELALPNCGMPKRTMENSLNAPNDDCGEANKRKISVSNKESKKNVKVEVSKHDMENTLNTPNNGCTEANKRTSGSEATLTADNVKCKAASANKEFGGKTIPKQKDKAELALPHCDLPKRTMENSLNAPNNSCGEANKRKVSGPETSLTIPDKIKKSEENVEIEDKMIPKQKKIDSTSSRCSLSKRHVENNLNTADSGCAEVNKGLSRSAHVKETKNKVNPKQKPKRKVALSSAHCDVSKLNVENNLDAPNKGIMSESEPSSTTPDKVIKSEETKSKDNAIPKQKEKIASASSHCDLPKRNVEYNLNAPANKRLSGSAPSLTTANNVKYNRTSTRVEETKDKVNPKQKPKSKVALTSFHCDPSKRSMENNLNALNNGSAEANKDIMSGSEPSSMTADNVNCKATEKNVELEDKSDKMILGQNQKKNAVLASPHCDVSKRHVENNLDAPNKGIISGSEPSLMTPDKVIKSEETKSKDNAIPKQNEKIASASSHCDLPKRNVENNLNDPANKRLSGPDPSLTTANNVKCNRASTRVEETKDKVNPKQKPKRKIALTSFHCDPSKRSVENNLNTPNNGSAEANKGIMSGSEPSSMTADNVNYKGTEDKSDKMILGQNQKGNAVLASPHCDVSKRNVENNLNAPNNGRAEADKRLSGPEPSLATALDVKWYKLASSRCDQLKRNVKNNLNGCTEAIDDECSLLMNRASESDFNMTLESCRPYTVTKPQFKKITSVETVQDECTDRVHISDFPDTANDSVTVLQTCAKAKQDIIDDDVVEVTEPTPMVDLTEDNSAPQEVLADLLLETKKEIEDVVGADDGTITLYRAEENSNDQVLKDELPNVVTAKNDSDDASESREASTGVTLVLDLSSCLPNKQTVTSPVSENAQVLTVNSLLVNNNDCQSNTQQSPNTPYIRQEDFIARAPVSNSHGPSVSYVQQQQQVSAPVSMPCTHQSCQQLPNLRPNLQSTFNSNVSEEGAVVDLTRQKSEELSSIDLKIIVEIFTRHVYFLAHLCSAQKAYVDSLNQRPFYSYYFKSEIALFEQEKRSRLYRQSLRLCSELQYLGIRANRNLSEVATLIVEHVTVSLKNKDMPKSVTKSIVYLLIGELLKPQVQTLGCVPLFRTLIRLCNIVTSRMQTRSSGLFTEEMRRTLALQIQEYNRLFGQQSNTSSNIEGAPPQFNATAANQIASRPPPGATFLSERDENAAASTLKKFIKRPHIATSATRLINEKCHTDSQNNANNSPPTRQQLQPNQQVVFARPKIPQPPVQGRSNTDLPGGPNTNTLGRTPRYLPAYDTPPNHVYASSNLQKRSSGLTREATLSGGSYTTQPPPSIATTTTHNTASNSSTQLLQQSLYEQYSVKRQNDNLLEELLRPSSNQALFGAKSPVNDNFRIKLPFTKPVTAPATTIATTVAGSPVSSTCQRKSEGATNLSSLAARLQSPPASLRSPPVSLQSETVVSQSKTVASQSKTSVTQSKAAVPQSKTAVSQNKAAVSQSKTAVSQNKAAVSQSKTAVSQNKAAVSQSKTVVSQSIWMPEVSSDSQPVLLQSKAAVSQSKTVVSQSVWMPEVNSDSQPVLLQSKAAVSQSNAAVSQSKAAVSQSKTVVSQSVWMSEVNSDPQPVAKTPDQQILVNNTAINNKYAVSEAPPSKVLNQGLLALSSIGQPSAMLLRSSGGCAAVPSPAVKIENPKANKRKSDAKPAPQKRARLAKRKKPPSTNEKSENAETVEISSDEDNNGGDKGAVEQPQGRPQNLKEANADGTPAAAPPGPTGSKGASAEADLEDFETIDLTWIDDMDEQELQSEMDFVFVKQENVENEAAEEPNNGRVAPSPVDSGIASPPMQNEEDIRCTVVNLCICGQIASYYCACGTALYCGQECQMTDWEWHQKTCQTVPRTNIES